MKYFKEQDERDSEFKFLCYFQRNYHKPKYINKLLTVIYKLYLEEYGKRSYGQCSSVIDCVCYNCVKALYKGYDGMYVFRYKNFYDTEVILNGKKVRFDVGYKGVINTFDLLEKHGYLIVKKGYNNGVQKENGYVLFTDSFVDLVNNSIKSTSLSFKVDNVVVLKDEQKNIIEYRQTKEVKAMIDSMTAYNNFMDGVSVVLDNREIPTEFIRSFSRSSFSLGGRIYSTGQGIQSLSKQERSRILIDGEVTNEADIKSLHCAILYEKKGIVLDEDWDCYANPNMLMGMDSDIVNARRIADPKFNPARSLFKVAMLIMLNAKDYHSAVMALIQKYNDDKKKTLDKQEYAGIVDFDPHFIFNVMRDHNSFISEHFFSDSGIMLQKVDSDIMGYILKYCVEHGIPVLPVHDSVIAPESRIGEVVRVMKEAFKVVVGSNQNCRIEV